MTAATAPSPFLGQTKSDNGGDFKTEIPSADVHEARIVALIDLGTHEEKFGNDPAKAQHKVYLVYELDEEMTGMKGVNHVVGVKYTLSWHEKAKLRQLAEAVLNEGQKYPAEFDLDYSRLLGQPCTVQIAHEKKVTEKGERTYAKVAAIAAVGKKKREKVFAPKREVIQWFLGQPLSELPDYAPRDYGEKIEDVIRRSAEMKAGGGADEGEIGPGGETPF